MENNTNQSHPITARELTDVIIRVSIVFGLVVMCFRVFSPFLNLMLWAVILGVTLYPMHQRLAAKFGGKQGRAATVIVLSGLLLIGVPAVKLASSMAEELRSVHEAYGAGTLSLRPPQESVAEWPLIGKQAYAAWHEASENLPGFIADYRTNIEAVMRRVLATAKGTAGGIALLLGALIVAGIMMAYGRGGSGATLRIFNRIAGPEQGPKVHSLVTMTTRSVAVGVLGVAAIQAVLMGLVFLLAGVPAAGLLALVVLLMAIMQLPAMLIGIPVILWIWNGGDSGTLMNSVWSVAVVITALADNVLKPMLLGRGVDAPMPVILIGALGGMVSSGFVGLFIGAVVLAVGYQIFMKWVEYQAQSPEEVAPASDPVDE
ncbi:AI-2E family transporter [Seongchinamella sediminis]|uniref:AI-2E family transporter n=1 Tax=Seongchinamella sediminis TaxID=2283635 RepID=A0A3L7DY70_9GAMM|nr:AI-2E family transporter [Seongchinamella sediminis]RLQ21579.1 AI-2E family transporter [Seongchinamella sediminis]